MSVGSEEKKGAISQTPGAGSEHREVASVGSQAGFSDEKGSTETCPNMCPRQDPAEPCPFNCGGEYRG